MVKICSKCRLIAMNFEIICSVCNTKLQYFDEWWNKNKNKREYIDNCKK